MKKKETTPFELFCKLEAEISKYGIAPPKTWPWAMYGKHTNLPLRNLQLLEFLEDLRSGKIKSPKKPEISA
jgi:hypothetical protein